MPVHCAPPYGCIQRVTHTHNYSYILSLKICMASFCRSAAPPRREWTVEDAASFAALKEFKLLQLLSADKKALMTARRLGLSLGQVQLQAQMQHPAAAADAAAAPTSSGAADDSSAASCATPRHARRRSARRAQRAARADAHTQTPSHANAAVGDAAALPARVARPVDMRADGAVPRANARQRRRAARSARHHAARRRAMRTAATAVLFLSKLRRRVRQRRAATGPMELSSPSSVASVSSKRGRSSSPTLRRAGSSAGNTPASAGSCASCGSDPEECADGLCGSCARCAREGRREHQRLRRGALAMLLAPS